MMTPDDIDVWVGLDVGKSAHHAHALDHDGNTLYDKPLKQDEKAIRTMLGKLSKHGRVLLVVDQPNTIGSLPLTVARNMGIAVAYLPGTAMRRTAQLLPGDAKTDRRDAHVIAWAALKLPETLRDAGPDDETLAALKLLAGHDEDLAHESTRHVNRLRSLLLQTHPAFERALKGERITRDATLALLERYGGPMGVKRAGIEDVKDWAKSNGLRAGRIIDDMFKAIGEQTVTMPGTAMAETIIPSIARDIKAIKDRRREVGHAGREAPGGPPSSRGPGVDARDRRQDRKQHPAWHRRRHRQLQKRGPPGRLRRHRTGHRPVRHQHQGRETLQTGQQTPQERAVAVLVRRVRQTPAVHRLLQAQTRTGQAPQRRCHLPRAPTLRRNLQHAQKRRPLPGTSPRSLNRATRERTPDATGRAKRAHDSQPESRHVNSPRS